MPLDQELYILQHIKVKKKSVISHFTVFANACQQIADTSFTQCTYVLFNFPAIAEHLKITFDNHTTKLFNQEIYLTLTFFLFSCTLLYECPEGKYKEIAHFTVFLSPILNPTCRLYCFALPHQNQCLSLAIPEVCNYE